MKPTDTSEFMSGAPRSNAGTPLRIRDVAQGPDGLIYLITDEGNGEVLRVSPTD